MLHLRTSSLSILLALALPACTPKDPGDTATDGSTGSGSTGSTGSTTTDPSSGTASSSTDAPTTSTTTASTGPDTASTGSSDASTAATTSGLPDGMCEDEFHGAYWCECLESDTEACGEDGFRTCFAQNDTVITHFKWGPCGECIPGDEMPCDAGGEPGRQFCNQLDYWVDDIDDLPTPVWGTCLAEADLVCEPGESKKCPDDIFSQQCDVDEQGVPFWTTC